VEEQYVQLLKAIIELGIAGLLFVMWWNERKDRVKAEDERKEKDELAREAHEDRATLIKVIENNAMINERLAQQIGELTTELRASRTRRLADARRDAS
jgi:hypothetical protein